MPWPTTPVSTTNLDAGTDNPQTARADLLDLVQKFNEMRAHVSAFAQTLLDDADAAAVRATLGATVTGAALLTAANAAAARSAIGATATGSSLLTAVDAPAARAVLGVGSSYVVCEPSFGSTTGASLLLAFDVHRAEKPLCCTLPRSTTHDFFLARLPRLLKST
jgi:hypothetical protein